MTSISSLSDSRLKVPPLLHGIDGLRRLFVHLDLLFVDEEQILTLLFRPVRKHALFRFPLREPVGVENSRRH